MFVSPSEASKSKTVALRQPAITIERRRAGVGHGHTPGAVLAAIYGGRCRERERGGTNQSRIHIAARYEIIFYLDIATVRWEEDAWAI